MCPYCPKLLYAQGFLNHVRSHPESPLHFSCPRFGAVKLRGKPYEEKLGKNSCKSLLADRVTILNFSFQKVLHWKVTLMRVLPFLKSIQEKWTYQKNMYGTQVLCSLLREVQGNVYFYHKK